MVLTTKHKESSVFLLEKWYGKFFNIFDHC